MKTHELKTWIEFFEEVIMLRKNFEVRKNDRDFKVGDWLLLNEWDNQRQEYTGSVCLREISYILHGGQFGIEQGFVVMGIKEVQ